MKRSDLFKLLARLGMASGMVLAGCDDTTTGVPTDPAQILVTRVTYTYTPPSGPPNIFGDTSAPYLCPGNPNYPNTKNEDDCNMSNYSASVTEGQNPTASPFVAPLADYNDCCLDFSKDSWSTYNNPAPPFSKEIRVVFNEVPLTMNGKDLETVALSPSMPENPTYTLQPGVVTVSCDECSMNPGTSQGDGLPTLSFVFDVDGSFYSSDPSGNLSGVQIPYGPAISVYTFAYNLPPFTSQPPPLGLEPNSTYHFGVNPTLTGSGGTAIGALTAQEQYLTTIHTAPFAVDTFGIGAPTDAAPNGSTVTIAPASCTANSGCSSNVCNFPGGAAMGTCEGAMDNDGVFTLVLNAAAYENIPDSAVTATFTSSAMGAMPTPVKAGIGLYTQPGCALGQRNQVFIFPASGTWAPEGTTGTVTITLDESQISSLSWKSGNPNGAGRNKLGGMVTASAPLTGVTSANDATMYAGQIAGNVASYAECAAGAAVDMATPPPADMSMPADMSKTTDMATKG